MHCMYMDHNKGTVTQRTRVKEYSDGNLPEGCITRYVTNASRHSVAQFLDGSAMVYFATD